MFYPASAPALAGHSSYGETSEWAVVRSPAKNCVDPWVQDFRIAVTNSNFGFLSHCFRDTAVYWLKITSMSFSSLPLHLMLLIQILVFCWQTQYVIKWRWLFDHGLLTGSDFVPSRWRKQEDPSKVAAVILRCRILLLMWMQIHHQWWMLIQASDG